MCDDLRCNQTNTTRLKASKSDCFQCGFFNVDYTGCVKSLSVAFSCVALVKMHPYPNIYECVSDYMKIDHDRFWTSYGHFANEAR